MGIFSLFASLASLLRRLMPPWRRAEERAREAEAPAPARVKTAAPRTERPAAAGQPLAISPVIRPVLTEKSTSLSSRGQYAFYVTSGATKQDVRRAVERQFGIHVTRVNTLRGIGKTRRRGAIVGRVPGRRKAIVTLRAGESIDMTGGRA